MKFVRIDVHEFNPSDEVPKIVQSFSVHVHDSRGIDQLLDRLRGAALSLVGTQFEEIPLPTAPLEKPTHHIT